MNEELLIEWFENRLSKEEGLENIEVKGDLDLTAIGLESINAVQITSELEDFVRVELPPDLLWELRNINDIIAFIMERKALID